MRKPTIPTVKHNISLVAETGAPDVAISAMLDQKDRQGANRLMSDITLLQRKKHMAYWNLYASADTFSSLFIYSNQQMGEVMNDKI